MTVAEAKGIRLKEDQIIVGKERSKDERRRGVIG